MNSNENQVTIEVFQPEINSQIKRTTLEEVREWIKEGKLQPNHQVRVKNLSWVEAHKIPAFQKLFESKKQEQAEQSNYSYSPTLTAASEQSKPQIAEEKPFSRAMKFSFRKENNSCEKEKSAAEAAAENESKTSAPSVVFQAFEKKFLAKDKQAGNKTEFSETAQEPQKKSPFRKKNASTAKNKKSFSQNKDVILKRIVFFVAGCFLSALIAYGGSYLWVYQLKTPAPVDEKSLPEVASLDDKLTSDKLGLRLKEEARKKELKESGNQENPAQHQDISQQIAQLEKQFDTARKTVIENQRIKLQEAEFSTTFSFSLAVMLVAFVLVGVFYGKNPQPLKNKKSAKLPGKTDAESTEDQDANEQKTGDKNSQNADAEQKNEAEKSASDDEISVEANASDFQDRPESFTKVIYVSENVSEIADAAENISEEKSQLSIRCFQHRNKPPKFYCDICENYFCADCTKTGSESGNYCPYCKLTCKPVEIRTGSDSPQTAPEEKKKPSLLELGKDSNFIVYDYPDERTGKLGIIPAFVIALLFSASISIFWVYKISPYLESRNQEISRNVLPNAAQNAETPNDKTAETVNVTGTNNGEPAASNEPCINPATKETFECDDETRRALYEQNRKTKAVEDAQRKVAEKSAVVASSEDSSPENANQNAQQPDADERAKKVSEKQRLIKTFGISFIIIFGLLLSTRLFHKEKDEQPD